MRLTVLGGCGAWPEAGQACSGFLMEHGSSAVHNLGGWLTTVVGRVCLDMLRSADAHREEPLDGQHP